MEGVINNTHTLSIRFSSDGLSLLVFDENQRTIASKRVDINTNILNGDFLKSQLEKLFDSKIEFTNTQYILDNIYYTVVPESVTDQNMIPELLAFQFKNLSDSNFEYCKNTTAFQHANVIFACPEAVIKAINKTSASIKHRATEFINFVARKRITGIYVAIRQSEIDIVVVKQQQLLLANSYFCENNSDIIYHLVNVASKLQLDIQETQKFIYRTTFNYELENLLNDKFSNININHENSILCV